MFEIVYCGSSFAIKRLPIENAETPKYTPAEEATDLYDSWAQEMYV